MRPLAAFYLLTAILAACPSGPARASLAQSASYTLQAQCLAPAGNALSSGLGMAWTAGEPSSAAKVQSASYSFLPGYLLGAASPASGGWYLYFMPLLLGTEQPPVTPWYAP